MNELVVLGILCLVLLPVVLVITLFNVWQIIHDNQAWKIYRGTDRRD